MGPESPEISACKVDAPEAARERHYSRVTLKARIHDEARSLALVHCADIADRVPDELGRRVDQDFLANGGHLSSPIDLAGAQASAPQ